MTKRAIRRSARRLAIAFISAFCLSSALVGVSQKTADTGKNKAAELPGEEIIRGYKQWTQVNPTPAVFASKIAIQCSAPAPAEMKMEAANPHRDKFVLVYVNELGKRPMLTEKFPHFPQGSIIVKEKLAAKERTTPELLTVMIKREKGFNPENGDWEYLALDGAGKEVQARGRLEKCQACHLMNRASDYVSRNYLPYELWKN